MPETKRIAIVGGGGYGARELVGLLAGHPSCTIANIASRSSRGKPVWNAHPELRGVCHFDFCSLDDIPLADLDGVVVAVEHGEAARVVATIVDRGFDGVIVDLSSDFRFRGPDNYLKTIGTEHPCPELIRRFQYGMPEINGETVRTSKWIANPGCFATGITLALHPIAGFLDPNTASVTALTGASGSGARPSAATHFPSRDGNVRAYKVFSHQHSAEIQDAQGWKVDFVPASGPWTRGIWGTAQLKLPELVQDDMIDRLFNDAYAASPLVRLWPGQLPELRWSVASPFVDIGWIADEDRLVIGFALDNLLKGAASQAIQNLNLVLGLPETAGLLPTGAADEIGIPLND